MSSVMAFASNPGRGLNSATKAALVAMARAHAPYSRFPVGAALLTDDGRVFAGANMEVISYPVGSPIPQISLITSVACIEPTTPQKAIYVEALRWHGRAKEPPADEARPDEGPLEEFPF